MINRKENIQQSNELILYFLSALDENSSFSKIRKYAKIAIEKGMVKDEKDKKQWVLSALENLQNLQQNHSIELRKVILSAIEVVILSRRVSNLRKAGIFSKKVNGDSNHIWLLKGAKLAISAFFPELNIHYLRDQSFKKIKNLFNDLKENTPTWIVLGYVGNLHLSLMQIIKSNDKLNVHLFDSLGSLPSKNLNSKTDVFDHGLYRFLSKLNELHHQSKLIVTGFNLPRQKDGCNCFSFVISDLDCELTLINKNENIFLENKEEYELDKLIVKIANINLAFHRVTQVNETIPNDLKSTNLIIPIKETNPSLGNPLALNISAKILSNFVKNDLLIFASKGYQEEGESEEDEEIYDCAIM